MGVAMEGGIGRQLNGEMEESVDGLMEVWMEG